MKAKAALTFVLLGLLSFSCGRGTSNQEPAATYKVGNVSPKGYFDLGALFGAIQAFPEGTMARQFTQSIQISGTARENLVLRLYKGGFVFEDVPAKETDLVRDYVSATQSGCGVGEQISLSTADGYTDVFDIVSCSAEQITIQEHENANYQYSFQLLDSMTLRLTKKFEAIDTCINATEDNPRQNPIVETVRLIKWGDADHIQSSEETVSLDMLQKIARGSQTVPDSISQMMTAGTGDVRVPASDLKALHETRLRNEVDLCPGMHPRRPTNPGTSPETGEGTEPEPDYPTAPGGSPEPVPAPTPAPTPTPSPRFG